ncbi:hypothetical protein I306_01418 [Cryptococcus gattii EJB2]|uniref:Uncharacterized protein n=1 Tax=Cryptococcus gattii EJB2 TaxID=1296103 RepID=A0ABR5C122_9TREE|nr:hypothetical protein I306_01418 [Cryptococcus gattii EJB2]KJE00511.1 hypothetical protein I311_05919 [Cryptococcus gattii NT-10]
MSAPPPRLPRPLHIHSSASCTDDDGLSSDDDEAIFFGAHKPEEAHLVAKLSAAIQPPAPFIPRVKKRDSREFLRRKTLLLTADKRNHKSLSLSAQDSARLYQSQLSDDEESCATPARFARPASISTPSQMGQDPSDLTLKFETWHLSTPRNDESESEEGGSDKENVPIPLISGVQGPVEAVSFEDLGMERHGILDLQGGGNDDMPQLNMGGLKLSDFADQESGVIFQGLDILDEFHLEDVTENIMAQPAESPKDYQPARSSTPLQPDESNLLDFDSPLEVARAGPVAIPVLSSHQFTCIRAEVGSPCRNLPPSPLISAPIAQENTSVKLANLESPSHQPPSLATPSRVTALPPADLVQRGAKTLKASTIKHAPAAAAAAVDTKKAAALKSAIRGQLDSAVLARINNPVASTQKNVPGSHTSSSSLAASKTFSENSLDENKSKQALPLQPRPEPRLVKKPISKPTAAVPLLSSSSTVNRTIPRPALLPPSKTSLPRPKSTLHTKTTSMLPPPSSIPLKRPASSQTNITSTRHTTTIPQSITRPSHAHSSGITFSKPLLGQPGRVFREPSTPLQVAPLFSVGVGVGDHSSSTMSMSRIALKSPAKQNLFKKPLGENHTPRKLGTPMRFGTPRQGQGGMFSLSIGACCPAPTPTPTPLSASVHAPITTTSANTSSKENRSPPVSNVASHDDSPPASHTRHAEEAAAGAILTPPSSSSRTSTRSSDSNRVNESQQEVSQPTPSSPSPQRPARTKRSTLTKSTAAKKPPSSKRPNPKSPKSATTTVSTPIAAPALTEKQLKTTTARNTARNQVYHCAIDRKIIRQLGPRPPSPTSKIRTTSEREEADKKKSRETRAKRRMGIHSEEEKEKGQQVIEKLEVAKAPGDEDDWTYKTPQRPLKRARRTSEADEHHDDDGDAEEERKKLRWDRVVSVIRDDGNASGSNKSSDDGKEKDGEELKSCIKTKVPLDEHGNVLDAQRPVDNLKRTRVVVTAVFYDGEEPVPAPATATRSKKK